MKNNLTIYIYIQQKELYYTKLNMMYSIDVEQETQESSMMKIN